MIRKVGISDVRRTGKYVLQRNKKTNVMSKRNIQLPAKKELQTNTVEQTNRNRIFASKCSEYEGYDYCTPLFP